MTPTHQEPCQDGREDTPGKTPSALIALGRLLIGAGLLSAPWAANADATLGAWTTPTNWPVVSIHSTLLHTGKVLFYPYFDDAYLWDPLTDSFEGMPRVGYSLFCTGHSAIGDGRILVTGGHVQNGWGLNDASYFDPVSNTWTRLPDMNNGRWYPSSTTLANGDVLVASGSYNTSYAVNTLPQVWQVNSGTWRNLTNANRSLPLYPSTFLAPNGQVFFDTSSSYYLDPADGGTWTLVARNVVSGRDNYSSSAMYDIGKVIRTGGGDPPTATTEVIDLMAPTPAWRLSGSMASPRRQHNITILPDGVLLATGGSSLAGFNNRSGAVLAAEMWDPTTETWTTMASSVRYRGYHSTALLLPDGRVISSGGDSEPNGEIYSPPYLFKGTRPVILSAPAGIRHGQSFFVGTTDTDIAKISLTRLSSVTHSQNYDQRINFLTFSPSTTNSGYEVTAPLRSQDCPPGYYMLWLINSNGVPSVASMVKVIVDYTPPANTPPVLAPVSNKTVDELTLLTATLSATDADLPAQALTYSLVTGPGGLTVSPLGAVAWAPTEAQGPGSYPVIVRVTDSGTPPSSSETSFSITVNEVADSVSRTVWQIGTDNSPSVLPYRPTAEFTQENNRNDVRPGKVTRLSGDPLYIAGTNPTADDDFYFQGTYPMGFNGLPTPLSVPNDEPPVAWERAHTANDRTNRVHFVLDAAQVTARSAFRLSFELVNGGSMSGGVVQPGFAEHDIAVNFKNATGVTTQLFSQRVSQTTNIVIPFAAAAVDASAGANTLEIVRTGPALAGVSYWIQYDYLRLESRPVANTPPVLVSPSNRVINELVPLSFQLSATDTDEPTQALTYSRVSGPDGLIVSPTGLVTWTPTEEQGPGNYTVEVRVTDNGFPIQSDTRQFTLQVNEVANPVSRTVWQLGIDNNPAVSPYRPTAEFSVENNKNDLPPGKVTRLSGDPEFVSATNPTADDDFYFQGTYYAGFNGLPSILRVPNDEPFSAWERSQTSNDRTNRLHFVLESGQVTAPSSFQLKIELVFGGSLIGGVVQPGFGDHDIVVRFRNTAGATTQLFDHRVSQTTNIVINFTAAAVGALAGANSIEIVRTGPVSAGVSYYINYDYLRLESTPVSNTAPILTQPPDLVGEISVPISATLNATDADIPAQTLTYSLVNGPAGLTISAEGAVAWTPTEAQGPGSYIVEARVTDGGSPSLSDSKQFVIVVNEIPDTTLRAVWQIGTNDDPLNLSYAPYGEFSPASGQDTLRPGLVTRLASDPAFAGTANPIADDDFYFRGVYASGFNGLLETLDVPNDEPPSAWEGALTTLDQTNRLHFILDATQVPPGSKLRLTFEFAAGVTAIEGVVQPDVFGDHDIQVRFRNESDVSTELFTSQISQGATHVLEFLTSTVDASPGPNTIEFVRSGPGASGAFEAQILFDFIRLEAIP